jgi:hypothetical protein
MSRYQQMLTHFTSKIKVLLTRHLFTNETLPNHTALHQSTCCETTYKRQKILSLYYIKFIQDIIYSSNMLCCQISVENLKIEHSSILMKELKDISTDVS